MWKWSVKTLSQVITNNFGSPNHLCNIPIADLGCLTYLLQSKAKNVQENLQRNQNFKSCCYIWVLVVIVIAKWNFSAITNAATMVNDRWPAVILGTETDNSNFMRTSIYGGSIKHASWWKIASHIRKGIYKFRSIASKFEVYSQNVAFSIKVDPIFFKTRVHGYNINKVLSTRNQLLEAYFVIFTIRKCWR